MVSTYCEGASVVIEGELVPGLPHTLRQHNTGPYHHDRIMERFHTLVDDQTILIDELAFPIDNGQRLAHGLGTGSARAVSDGSLKDSYGTAAGVLSVTEDDNEQLLFVNSVPGLHSDQNSYRSELAGILGILLIEVLTSKLVKSTFP